MKNRASLISILAVIIVFTASVSAQQSSSAQAVPNVINYSGMLTDLNGKPLSGVQGVTFLLYSAEQGGNPLWMETQNVTAAKNGQYTVTLGSTTAQGLPSDIFSSGEARWLGVQASGQPEQPRILLVAVPYALKASDAQTIGGLPPSAFMLANAKSSSTANSKTPANPDVTGAGTADYIPMWDSASDIVNSTIFEKSSEVGIGTAAPEATLDVNGKSDIRDTLTLFPKSTDNTLAISGTAFKVSSTGAVTFVSGQTFPGAGTITGITTAAGSGLSGGGTSGTLSLKIPAAGVTNAMLADSKVTLNANSAGGLTTPGAMTLGSTYTIGLKACTAKQILQFNGTAWACSSAGTGTLTGITTASTSGLSGGGTSGTLNLAIAAGGVTNTMLKSDSVTLNANSAGGLTTPGAMTLGSTYTIGLKPCSATQVLQNNGTAWECSSVGSGTITGVTAGSGLSGGGITGAVTLTNTGVLGITAGPGISTTGGQSPTLSVNTSLVPELSSANTFTGTQTFDNSVTVQTNTAPLTMQGSNATTTGLQAVLSNTNTSGPSFSIFSSHAANGGVVTQFYSDGNGTGPLGTPGGYFGTYTNTPIGFFTNNTERMLINNAGLIGINTNVPKGMLDIEQPSSISVQAAMYANTPVEGGIAVYGNSSSTTDGAGVGVAGYTFGSAPNAYGVEGIAANGNSGSNGVGVYGQSSALPISDGGGVGVFGQFGSESTTGQFVSGNFGVWGDGGPSNGVLGTADDNSAGYFLNNSPGGVVTLAAFTMNSAAPAFLAGGISEGFCSIDSNGDLGCSGSVTGNVPLEGGSRHAEVAAILSPQNWFEDAGSGQLVNGVAVITFDSDFAQTVNTGIDYKVFPVPNGDCKGLYVTRKTATSFEVRELGGGTSNVAFDYRIMALRKDYETIRFADRTAAIEKQKMLMEKMLAKNPHPVSHNPPKRPLPPPAKSAAFNSNRAFAIAR